MPGPTTYRSELPDGEREINRGNIITLGPGRAGSNPQNPIAAGMGLTIAVRGSESTVAVTAVMRYDLDPSELSELPVTMTPDGTQVNTWTAEGAVGGARLGFPPNLDYDTPKPFTLRVTVVDLRGSSTEAYTLWVGASEHFTEAPCFTREGFSALLQNCCFNGHGFRANEDIFGFAGPYDIFFDATSFGWALGVGYLTNGLLGKNCTPNRALLNPYIPDSISGLTSNPPKPDNPFVQPAGTAVPQVVPYDLLGAAQRVPESVDGSAAQLGLQVVTATAPPDDPDGNAFADPPGYESLSPASYPAPEPPNSRATGLRRGALAARFPDQPVGSQFWFDRDTPPRLEIALTGMHAGETAYFFAHAMVADFAGEPTATAGANGFEKIFPGTPLVFRRVTGAGAAVSPLVSRLHVGDALGGSLAAFTSSWQPFAITGGSTWVQAALGGVATIGTGQTALTFRVPVDVEAMNQVSAFRFWLQAAVEAQPGWAATLVLQAVVCRPGTAPIATGGGGSFGVDWPQGAYLTNPVFLRMKDS